MNMVFHTVNPVKFTVLVFDDAPDVFIQIFAIGFFDRCLSVFCSKNNVIEDLAVTAYVLIRLNDAVI